MAIIQDDMPMTWIGHQSWIWALSKKVTGFVPYPDGMIRLAGVKKAD
jgi:peptide/nickel transport system substrate-binding protein